MKDIHPWVIYVGSLIFGIGGWIITLTTWAEATSTKGMGGLLMIVGSVTVAAMGGSIIRGEGK